MFFFFIIFNFPGADVVQTTLAARGITSAAGMRMPISYVTNSTASALTLTAATGETVIGTATVNASTSIAHYVFTGAATADIIVFQV